MIIVSAILSSVILAQMTSALNESAYGANGQTNHRLAVEMKFTGLKYGKPPLKLLSYEVTLRNNESEPRWFIFPSSVYTSGGLPLNAGGIHSVEVVVLHGQGRAVVAHFNGNIALQQHSAGGFQALLLPGHSLVHIRDFAIELWGDQTPKLDAIIAGEITIEGKAVSAWLGVDLLSDKLADVTASEAQRITSKATKDFKEICVKVVEESRMTFVWTR